MPRVVDRTREDCARIASGYSTRNQFKKAENAVYYYARKYGWLNEICGHMISKWNERTKAECLLESLKYNRRIDFAKNSASVYYYARSRNWLDDICQHMPMIVNTKRTKEECLTIAKQFNRRVDFLTADSGAYQKAADAGWLNEICAHMIYAPPPLTNVLYLWKAKNTDIWKIGVSNEYTVEERINKVAKEHIFEVESKYTIIRNDARKIESLLLKMGKRVDSLERRTGFSEFRTLTSSEIQEALKYFVKEKV